MVPEYTLVVGVDRRHIRQFEMVWPTWRKHKPSLLKAPMVIFYDRLEVSEAWITRFVDHPNLVLIPWPAPGVVYEGDPNDKWTHPQRSKMLAGFVHVPASVVTTPYWLKVDTDVVANSIDDWIDEKWFDGNPGIVAHRWGFTKPPNQIELLDRWAERYKQFLPLLTKTPPLDLHPNPGSDRVSHKRIISWCGFFSTTLTRYASHAATLICGEGQLPVPSQDGYLWYVAARMEQPIVRTMMKSRGWEWWNTEPNIRRAAEEALRW